MGLKKMLKRKQEEEDNESQPVPAKKMSDDPAATKVNN